VIRIELGGIRVFVAVHVCQCLAEFHELRQRQHELSADQPAGRLRLRVVFWRQGQCKFTFDFTALNGQGAGGTFGGLILPLICSLNLSLFRTRFPLPTPKLRSSHGCLKGKNGMR
jgi:hypothetical protein